MTRRSMLLGGLRLVLARSGAVVWTYIANLGVALLFTLRLHAQLASMLDHSLAAERLNAAFDMGTLASVFFHLGHRVPSQGAAAYGGVPVYFLIYFLLVPGALFAYRTSAPAKLGTMLSVGVSFFWRFVRITLLTLIVSGIVLGPLMALQSAWANHVNEHVVGFSVYWHLLPGWILIVLVASILRLYFDLVEVYTVQLDEHLRPNGKPDRRVRRTLIPAAKALWRNLGRALGTFLLVGALSAIILGATTWIAVHTLAQPRVWPAFLLVQCGMFFSLFARYWQRGAETMLAAEFPLVVQVVVTESVPVVEAFVPEEPGRFRMPGRESDETEG